jgi:hypothetical protein
MYQLPRGSSLGQAVGAMAVPSSFAGDKLRQFSGASTSVRVIPCQNPQVGPNQQLLFQIPQEHYSYMKPGTLTVRGKLKVHENALAIESVVTPATAAAEYDIATGTAALNMAIRRPYWCFAGNGVEAGGASSLFKEWSVTFPGNLTLNYQREDLYDNAVLPHSRPGLFTHEKHLTESRDTVFFKGESEIDFNIQCPLPVFNAESAVPLLLMNSGITVQITTSSLAESILSGAMVSRLDALPQIPTQLLPVSGPVALADGQRLFGAQSTSHKVIDVETGIFSSTAIGTHTPYIPDGFGLGRYGLGDTTMARAEYASQSEITVASNGVAATATLTLAPATAPSANVVNNELMMCALRGCPELAANYTLTDLELVYELVTVQPSFKDGLKQAIAQQSSQGYFVRTYDRQYFGPYSGSQYLGGNIQLIGNLRSLKSVLWTQTLARPPGLGAYTQPRRVFSNDKIQRYSVLFNGQQVSSVNVNSLESSFIEMNRAMGRPFDPHMITTFKSSFIGKKVHFQVNPKASDNSTTFSATHQANALYRAELLNQDATIAATLLAGYNDASLVRGTLAATGGTPFASLHNTSAEQLLEYINNHQSARGTYAGRCFLAGHSCQVTDDYQFANQGIPVQNIVLQFEAHRALPPVKDIRKWGYIESPMRAGQGNDNQLHVWLMHDTMFVVGLDGGCSLLK